MRKRSRENKNESDKLHPVLGSLTAIALVAFGIWQIVTEKALVSTIESDWLPYDMRHIEVEGTGAIISGVSCFVAAAAVLFHMALRPFAGEKTAQRVAYCFYTVFAIMQFIALYYGLKPA